MLSQISPLSADLVERARDVPILDRLIGFRLLAGAEYEGPCPACGGVNRCRANIKKQTFFCRQCGAKGNVVEFERLAGACDFRTAIERLAGVSSSERLSPHPAPSRRKPEPSNTDLQNLASAARIVERLCPITSSPEAMGYFRDVRKIDVDAIADVLEHTDAIGWNPQVSFREPGHDLDGRRLGCIVGNVTDPVSGRRTGAISRTYIHQGLKVGKAKSLGSPAGIVRLSPDDEVLGGLHLAEGLETALFAMGRGVRPIWSTGSTALMSSFPALAGVEALTIFVDHDTNGAGERAARQAEARWLAADREVRLIRTRSPGDINDAAMRRAS